MSIRKAAAGLAGLAGLGFVGSLEYTIRAADADRYAHLVPLKWEHHGYVDSFDYRSVRRGYEVYKNVCAACHSARLIKYRMFRNVFMTPEEVKAEAKRATYLDGPNVKGEMFERSGTPADSLPNPYPNDEAAAYANGGKLPPDLSLIVKGRHGHEDYLFYLLTGYSDPPAGFEVDEGLYFNPYFRGGLIAMPPPLYNEVLEYSDGTPATKSQCAKDVTVFLAWCAEPWKDHVKKNRLKWHALAFIGWLGCLFIQKNVSKTYTSMRVFRTTQNRTQ